MYVGKLKSGMVRPTFILLIAILIILQRIAIGEPQDFIFYDCSYYQGKYTTNSSYKANLIRPPPLHLHHPSN